MSTTTRRWAAIVLALATVSASPASAAGPPAAAARPPPTAGTVTAALSAAPAPASGFVLPVPPPLLVLTPFDPPAEKWGSGHRGVDLAARPGDPVSAAADGVVAFAGMVAGRPVVSVKHSASLRTTYEPVDPSVQAGQRVRSGQQLGRLTAGHPSCSPTACLHWGARIGDDVYVDPLGLLAGLRVRLKPWDG